MTLFKNKKGIELSINFIVMLVLAISVFIGGIAFATKFFQHAEDVRGSLDSETERQIERLLDSGSPVVLPISTKEIHRNKYDTVGLGVFAMYKGDYTIKQKFKTFIDKTTNRPDSNQQEVLDVKPSPDLISLEKNQKGKFLILIKVPKDAPRGTYIYEYSVAYSDPTGATDPQPDYDNPVQLIIKVP